MSNKFLYWFSSVQFSHSVVLDSFWPHELQHARLPCPSPTLRAYSNSCPLCWWCHIHWNNTTLDTVDTQKPLWKLMLPASFLLLKMWLLQYLKSIWAHIIFWLDNAVSNNANYFLHSLFHRCFYLIFYFV